MDNFATFLSSQIRPTAPTVRTIPDGFFEKWREVYFPSNSIARSHIETAITELMKQVYLYRYRYDLVPETKYFDKIERNEWFEGIPSFAAHIGRKLAFGIASTLRSGELLTYESFEKTFTANYRSVMGPNDDLPFNIEWANDPEFIDKWSNAIKNAEIDLHDRRLFLLAILWDSYPFTLRMCSDSAACEIIRIAYDNAKEPSYNLDTYRKDIRGTRRGLSLVPPSRRRIVYTWSHRTPRTFFVRVSAAKTWDIDINELASHMNIGGHSYKVDFID